MTARRSLLVFGAALALGAAGVLLATGVPEWRRAQAVPAHQLARGVSISEQLHPDAMPYAHQSFETVIDMRPDGEAAGQPTSTEMAAAAHAQHLGFAYVPVPHGDIPENVVASLSTALAGHAGPVLLYCRSGRRAARAWSLVEAGRAGGLGVDEILAAVKASGQDADDLRANLEKRVRTRPSVTPATP